MSNKKSYKRKGKVCTVVNVKKICRKFGVSSIRCKNIRKKCK